MDNSSINALFEAKKQLEDIATSLRVLSGRATAKQVKLEQEVNDLDNAIDMLCYGDPSDLSAQTQKRIDELNAERNEMLKEILFEEERLKNE